MAYANSAAPAVASINLPGASASSASASKEKRPSSTRWINVGYWVSGQFIVLSRGIPFDDVGDARVYGSDLLAVQRAQASDALRDQFAGIFATMGPGERKYLTTEEGVITIELSTVKDGSERPISDPATNPYLIKLA